MSVTLTPIYPREKSLQYQLIKKAGETQGQFGWQEQKIIVIINFNCFSCAVE
jgi:hypothetical protein